MNPRPAGARHWTRRTPERIRRGTDSHAAVLSEEQIADLYAAYDGGATNKSALARQFGVSRITIWRHLKDRNRNTC